MLDAEVYLVLFWMALTFAMLFLNKKQNKEISSLKMEVEAWKAQAMHSLKKLDEQKVRSYSRTDFNLKQAMIQQTQADIASRLQSYLSTEGFYANS